MINEKHKQGTHCTKMGADKLAENASEPDKTQCGFIGFSWDVLGPIKKGVAFCIHNPNDTSQMP